MSDRTCGICHWFAAWPDHYIPSWENGKEGVCTSPRPLLGPEPLREVSKNGGKHCAAFRHLPADKRLTPLSAVPCQLPDEGNA